MFGELVSTNSSCPSCQAQFNCGKLRDAKASCWCESVQARFPVPASAKCFCPKCIVSHVNEHVRGPLDHSLCGPITPYYAKCVQDYLDLKSNSKEWDEDVCNLPPDKLNIVTDLVLSKGSPQDVRILRSILYGYGLLIFSDNKVYGPPLRQRDIPSILALLLGRQDGDLAESLARLTDPRDVTPPKPTIRGDNGNYLEVDVDQIPIELLTIIRECEFKLNKPLDHRTYRLFLVGSGMEIWHSDVECILCFTRESNPEPFINLPLYYDKVYSLFYSLESRALQLQ